LALFFLTALLPAQSPSQAPQRISCAEDASKVLMQMSEALEGHSQKQFLALFDLDKMQDGEIFKQQISLYFSQTESIRVHMNMGEVVVNGQNATVFVDAEIEAEPRNGGPVAHKNEQITFIVSPNCKFIDVQPRGFFSLP
jgi:hypothetical protein